MANTNYSLTTILLVALVVAVIASVLTANITGNIIKVKENKKGPEVYTKGEVDGLMRKVYTKSEVDSLLRGYVKKKDTQTQCSDSIDNDSDGKIDLSDPDCTGSDDFIEGPY